MDYFTDVYLKRINKHGNTMQDRIHGKMECDFENKLRKSVNRVELYETLTSKHSFGEGILQTKKISEKETWNYLLTRIEEKYENGSVFYTYKPFTEEKQAWLILFKEQYETIGYNRYIVLLLENELTWIGDDGLIYSEFTHYVGSMDSGIRNQFKIESNVVAATPSKTLEMICAYTPNIKRDLRINISDETWRVVGYDKISIPGIMYVTLEEDYVQKTELAGEEELKKWSITSSQGLEIAIAADSSTPIDFYTSYNGSIVDQEVELSSEDKNVQIKKVGFNCYSFVGNPVSTKIVAQLKNAHKVTQEFDLTITKKPVDWMSIVGPNQIKVLQVLEYELATSLSDYTVNIESQNGCFKIDKVEGNKVYIQGINIGEDNILITHNGATYSTPLKVISPWM